jgi:glycosyltransferase involved in cell wall biosynthesis
MMARRWRRDQDVAIIPPGIDRLYREAEPSDLARPTILFLGTWTPRKGIRDLAAAFPTVLAALPEARLVVAGAHLPRELVLHDFPEWVRPAIDVAPPATEAGLLALMQQCSVTALPSQYEGFGMAFAEAMALGLPVVGTPTGGMADAIQTGVNGVLVPRRAPAILADALTRLTADRDYRTRLGRAARATVQAWTWERAARETEAVYRECLDGAVAGPRPLPDRQPVEPLATAR